MIKLPKAGWVSIVYHRPMSEGTIKNVHVSKNPDGSYYVSLSVTCAYEPPLLNRYNKLTNPDEINVVGIDMSLQKFIVSSDASRPIAKYGKEYRSEEKHIRRLQQTISRRFKYTGVDEHGRKTHSRNYFKAREKYAKLCRKVADRRRNYLINMALFFARGYDAVCIEDLDMKAMSRTLKLGKSVMDLGWGTFVRWLELQCERYDTVLYKADKWFASSKTCSRCGYVNKGLELSDRSWECPDCGAKHDRDYNAAMNLRNMLLEKIKAVGTSASDCGDTTSTLRETVGRVLSVKQ